MDNSGVLKETWVEAIKELDSVIKLSLALFSPRNIELQDIQFRGYNPNNENEKVLSYREDFDYWITMYNHVTEKSTATVNSQLDGVLRKQEKYLRAIWNRLFSHFDCKLLRVVMTVSGITPGIECYLIGEDRPVGYYPKMDKDSFPPDYQTLMVKLMQELRLVHIGQSIQLASKLVGYSNFKGKSAAKDKIEDDKYRKILALCGGKWEALLERIKSLD